MLVEQVPPVVGLNIPVRGHQSGEGEDFWMDGRRADSLQPLGEAPDQLGHREAMLPGEGLERVHFVGGHFKIQHGAGHKLSVGKVTVVGSPDKSTLQTVKGSHLDIRQLTWRPNRGRWFMICQTLED